MIQKLLISYILKPLGKLMDYCGEKTREALFVLFSLFIFLISFVQLSPLFPSTPYIVTFAAGCFCMGMMILSMLRADIQPVRFSPVLIGLWLSAGILMTIAAVRFNVDWLSDAIMYVIACPIAFIVWGNVDYRKILRLLIRSCVVSFVIFFIVSSLFFPLDSTQYKSFFSNPNGTSGYLAIAFACLLINAFQDHNRLWKKIVSWVLLGLCGGVLYYTNSRSGQLATICTFSFAGILFVFQNKHEIKQRILYRLLPIVLSLLILIPGTLYIMQVSYNGMCAVTDAASSIFNSADTDPSVPNGSTDGDKGTNAGDNPDEDNNPFIDYNAVNQANKDRFNASGKDLNSFTTGRADIWKAFLDKSTPFGTGEQPSFYIESINKTYSNPHMTLLLFAYQYGWICAGIYLLFNVLSGFKSIYFVLKNKTDVLSLLPFAITITYGIIFLLETVNLPFVYMSTVLYFFVQAPLLKKTSHTEHPAE